MALSQQPGGRSKPTNESKPKRPPTKAVVPKSEPNAAEAQAELADLGAVMEAAEDLGLRYKVTSTANAAQELRRFERWLDELHGLELDDILRPGSRPGWQGINGKVVLAYFTACARYGAITKGSFENNRDRLFLAFRVRRIEPPGDDIRRKIAGLASNLQLGDRRPTAAVYLGCGLEEIVDAIVERHDDDPLWSAALRAYTLTAAFFGGRITETLAHLRWGNLKLDGCDSMTLTWPAGLKYQFEPVTLKHEVDDGGEVKYSPVDALRSLRTLSAAAGLPTDDKSRIFPIRVDDVWSMTAEEERIADTSWLPELTEDKERRHAARAANSATYRTAWTQPATSTEWSKHVGWRRIAPHGLRRGQATLMLVEGRSLFEIQLRLRHATPAVTLKYTDGTHLDTGDVTALLGAEPDPDAKADFLDRLGAYDTSVAAMLELGDAADVDDSDEPLTNLPILDWASGCVECGAKQANIWAIQVAGEWTVLCGPHAKRLRILGEDGDWRDFGMRCEVDGCDTDISAVDSGPGLARDTDGQEMRVCPPHYQRYRRYKDEGDDSWMSLRRKEFTIGICEATGYAADGVTPTKCNDKPIAHITLHCGTDLEVCSGHYQRLKKQMKIAESKGETIEVVNGVISGQWGTPLRPRFKPGDGPDCQFETSRGPCGKPRVGWVETAMSDFVACCSGHKSLAQDKELKRTDRADWPVHDVTDRLSGEPCEVHSYAADGTLVRCTNPDLPKARFTTSDGTTTYEVCPSHRQRLYKAQTIKKLKVNLVNGVLTDENGKDLSYPVRKNRKPCPAQGRRLPLQP